MTGGSMQKKWPGSHVIVRTKDGELPDRTFEEARPPWQPGIPKDTLLPRIEIDYIQKKHVKKPAGGKTWFCCLLYQLFSDGFSGYFRSEEVTE